MKNLEKEKTWVSELETIRKRRKYKIDRSDYRHDLGAILRII
jgi:hypothetical protein